jgi:predicted nucleic acid-binding protein
LEKYTPKAPDPEDLPFVEAAVAARADAIVTGNHDHFSFFAENPWGIQILSPRQCYQRVCNK